MNINHNLYTRRKEATIYCGNLPAGSVISLKQTHKLEAQGICSIVALQLSNWWLQGINMGIISTAMIYILIKDSFRRINSISSTIGVSVMSTNNTCTIVSILYKNFVCKDHIKISDERLRYSNRAVIANHTKIF